MKMNERAHSKLEIALSAGTLGAISSVLMFGCALVCVATVAIHHEFTDKPSVTVDAKIPTAAPVPYGAVDKEDIEAIENAYGPLNENALNETKEGILRNIIARRRQSCGASQWTRSVQCVRVQSRCGVQSRAYSSVQYQSCRPSCPTSSSAPSCAPSRPVVQPENPTPTLNPVTPKVPDLPNIESQYPSLPNTIEPSAPEIPSLPNIESLVSPFEVIQ